MILAVALCYVLWRAVKGRKEYETRIECIEKNFEKNLEERLSIERERINDDIEQEYNDAIETQKSELQEQIKKVDEMLGERIQEIAAKNTLTFTCSCNKNRRIPVEIDFTKENRFTCDNCGSVYRVELRPYPVLLSNVSNNQTLANIFQEK